MRVCLVFNPLAGTAGRIKDFLIQMRGAMRWELRVVTSEGDMAVLADDLKSGQYDRVVLGGGDGTMSLLVKTLAPEFPPVEIALLPFGTGNDLARSLGIDEEDVAAAFERAVEGEARPIDAVRMESEHGTTWFVNVANGGIGGAVASDLRAEDKKRWGPLAYWLAGVGSIVNPEEYQIRMTLDDDLVIDDSVLGVAIANGRYVGHGFPVARDAMLDDGMLAITTVPSVPTVELVAAGVDHVLRRDRNTERVRTYRAASVRLESVPDMPYSLDGEAIERHAARFVVEPGVLRVVPGPAAEGLRRPGEDDRAT